ncbi:hypothetical protein CRENBAI_010215 [Crenichthys baileyi]|uniref:Uncharacterized protein n=1 Tax=Crenichthys baileyi TaxID=28760 RepID=A0AAV9RKP4_9TELE
MQVNTCSQQRTENHAAKTWKLYCEVRSSRGGVTLDSMRPDDNAVSRLSMHLNSTGSSLLSDNSRSERLSSSTQSEPTRNPPSPR